MRVIGSHTRIYLIQFCLWYYQNNDHENNLQKGNTNYISMELSIRKLVVFIKPLKSFSSQRSAVLPKSEKMMTSNWVHTCMQPQLDQALTVCFGLTYNQAKCQRRSMNLGNWVHACKFNLIPQFKSSEMHVFSDLSSEQHSKTSIVGYLIWTRTLIYYITVCIVCFCMYNLSVLESTGAGGLFYFGFVRYWGFFVSSFGRESKRMHAVNHW